MSIRAMNWAMEQATGDPRSQCLLYVIADCANPDGVAFPAIKFMAAKSQQSKATVQRRLKELEEMGALARFPRWEDEDGKINAEGRGRRTSDEIRLILDAHIDRSAAADDDDHGGPESGTPPSQPDTPPSQPDTPPSQAATPPVAQLSDGGPSHCGDPQKNLQSEPEDSPPCPPPGGDGFQSDDCEGKDWPGFDTWPEFERAWSEPILRQSIARRVWAGLTEDERKSAIRAAKGYVAWRARQKKPPNVINAHTFLRERDSWVRFAPYAPPEAKAVAKVTIAANSAAWRGFCVVKRIWNAPPPDGRVEVAEDAVRGLESLAALHDAPAEWLLIGEPEQRAQVQAWTERLGKCGFRMPPPQRIDTGEVHPVLGPVWRHGWQVPCEWPPRMDGTLSTTGPPASPAMTEEDHAELSKLR